ncbi:MAG: hypothetical protein JWM99_4505 [Verrucomicrobiales bacterium]|nr:hypothetical protein [Verrucomicrobiales bacterium]
MTIDKAGETQRGSETKPGVILRARRNYSWVKNSIGDWYFEKDLPSAVI